MPRSPCTVSTSRGPALPFRTTPCTALRPVNCRARGKAPAGGLSHEEDPVCSTSGRPLAPRSRTPVVGLGAAALTLLAAHPALAFHVEPANALSIPTWAIHVSSVAEWGVAMALMWRLAEATGNERWKGMAWGMVPSLGGAMCACTWHFFYNSPSLEFLVALQAGLTVVGNFTCWIAAYRIYDAARQEGQA